MLTFLGSLGAIILVDLALSGDNALIIGAAAAGLPRRQRTLAIVAGGGAAAVLRILFAVAATSLLGLPLLSAVGGLALLVIAARLLMGRDADGRERGGDEEKRATAQASRATRERSFMGALLTILVADVTMSLDNVLAIGGLARGELPLLAVGLALSVGLLLVGSALVAALIARLPWLLDLAALVLGWTAGAMIAHDRYAAPVLHAIPYASITIPVVATLLALAIDIALRARARRRRGASVLSAGPETGGAERANPRDMPTAPPTGVR